MKKAILVLGSAVLLTACESNERIIADSPYGAPAPMASQMEMDVAAGVAEQSYSKQADTSKPAPEPNSDNPSSQSFLAYRYNYTFALPAKAVKPAMEGHMKICVTAGPDKCQVLRSHNSQHSDTKISAFLSLRAEPGWLKTYAKDVQDDVEAAKGEMRSSDVSAEDLTRQILDTDARLKAQITLRDRLQGLLETRNAELKDLLALERELARVQSQIESATTTLNVLRKRVSMSVVDIHYNSQSVAVSRSAFAPIGDALKDFFRTLSRGLASVIYFFAAILPWLLLVILPGLWLLRWFWRRRRQS